MSPRETTRHLGFICLNSCSYVFRIEVKKYLLPKYPNSYELVTLFHSGISVYFAHPSRVNPTKNIGVIFNSKP